MTLHKTVIVDGLSVFYREAGEPGAPKLVLLGGFPASSHQFRNLIPALADRFHVLSPDYPGFGNTDMPDPQSFPYTFDRLSEVVEGLLVKTGSQAPASSCKTSVAQSDSAFSADGRPAVSQSRSQGERHDQFRTCTWFEPAMRAAVGFAMRKALWATAPFEHPTPKDFERAWTFNV